MRLSSEHGMWGRAIYFAENASYSQDWSFKAEGGLRKMFLAMVILGDCIELPLTKGMVQPPYKPGTSIPYDSVKGHTGGSDVYMVYANQKCIPRYLVTFEP